MPTTSPQVQLIRLYLEEGRSDEALTRLETIDIDNQHMQLEVAYLFAWTYIQRKQLADARRVLSSLIDPLNESPDPFVSSEREQLALTLLHISRVALELGYYQEATEHVTFCLKVLQERRVSLPVVRIKARYYLARSCSARGLYTRAVRNYEDALRLSRHYNDHDLVPLLYFWLSDAYRLNRQYEKAAAVAREALQIYSQQNNRKMVMQVDALLGNIAALSSHYGAAREAYQQALLMAEEDTNVEAVVMYVLALLEISLQEGKLDEASGTGRQALALLEQVSSQRLRGAIYYTLGQLALAQAEQGKSVVFEEATTLFRSAADSFLALEDYAKAASAQQQQAHALERLGRDEEAIACLREGYSLLVRLNTVHS